MEMDILVIISDIFFLIFFFSDSPNIASAKEDGWMVKFNLEHSLKAQTGLET